MELSIETNIKGSAHILEIKGEVDLYSSPTMREHILSTIKHHHPQTLLVDLTQVLYMDSSGIATLVEGLQLSNEHHIRFKLVGLSPVVLEVFELARLERVFNIYTTTEEALRDT